MREGDGLLDYSDCTFESRYKGLLLAIRQTGADYLPYSDHDVFQRTTEEKANDICSNDPGGIVYIPRRLTLRGMGTGQTHVLRVQSLELPPTPFVFSI